MNIRIVKEGNGRRSDEWTRFIEVAEEEYTWDIGKQVVDTLIIEDNIGIKGIIEVEANEVIANNVDKINNSVIHKLTVSGDIREIANSKIYRLDISGRLGLLGNSIIGSYIGEEPLMSNLKDSSILGLSKSRGERIIEERREKDTYIIKERGTETKIKKEELLTKLSNGEEVIGIELNSQGQLEIMQYRGLEIISLVELEEAKKISSRIKFRVRADATETSIYKEDVYAIIESNKEMILKIGDIKKIEGIEEIEIEGVRIGCDEIEVMRDSLVKLKWDEKH